MYEHRFATAGQAKPARDYNGQSGHELGIDRQCEFLATVVLDVVESKLMRELLANARQALASKGELRSLSVDGTYKIALKDDAAEADANSVTIAGFQFEKEGNGCTGN